jgi:CubicO group peptidase (beta-lactamase class C family)
VSHTSPLAIAILLAAAAPLSPSKVAAQARPAAFDAAWRETAALFRAQARDDGIVGASLWFLQDGEVLAREHHGMADLETGRRIDDQTIFHWGSITKTLTGIAIMQLRDRGRLTLDDPIVEYLPELRAVHNPFGPMESITLRHLMSHSAGFRNGTWPWGGSEAWHPHEPTEWSQLVAMMPYTEILFEPGSRYSYSNPGIVFLGRVIEILSGDDWEVYVDKNIFKPLGMHRSYFDHTPYHLLPYRSNNYTVVDGTPRPNGLDFDTGITVSNGGLNAPIPDMVTYLSFLLGVGDAAATEGVLRRASLDEMWQAQVPVTPPNATGALRESMALTFFVEETGGRRLIGHTGSQKAFFSFFYIDPAARTAAIAAFNSNGGGPAATRRPDTRAILERVRARLFEAVFPLFQ